MLNINGNKYKVSKEADNNNLSTVSRTASSELRRILEQSPIGIAIVSNQTNKRIFVNQRLLDMFGATSYEAFLNQDISETWVDKTQLHGFRDMILSGTDIVDYEAQRFRQDGSIWWVLLSARMAEFEGVKARSIWHLDITDRKKTEDETRNLNLELEKRVEKRTQKLRKSEALFRAVVNHSPTIIHLKDIEGRYTLINKHAEIFLNTTEKNGLGKTSKELFSEDESEIYQGHDQEVLETLKPVERETLIKLNGQDYIFLTTKFPIFEDGNISGIGTIATDITEHVHIKEHLQEALINAEQANHSKSQFLATMSHELRTPLNAILGFSDVIRGQYFGPLGELRYKEYASDIYDSGEHLLSLISDILDISAVEAGKRDLLKVDVDLRLLIEECTKLILHSATQSDVTMLVDVADNLPSFHADERAIKQIILNIVSNAVKFSSANSEVSLSVQVNKQNIIIKVRDAGAGIESKFLPVITDPFVRGHSGAHLAQEGTGLGLAIVKHLVSAHDGQLSIDSEVSKGTTVTVSLPY